MRTLIILSLISIIEFGCGQTRRPIPIEKKDFEASQEKQLATVSNAKVGKFSEARNDKSWIDSLIENYVFHSKNPLVAKSHNNKAPEEWIFDQTIKTDTANFLVFQIGHDELDNGQRNKRFVTDKWIYIDSLTKRLYEYDIASDSLTLWSN